MATRESGFVPAIKRNVDIDKSWKGLREIVLSFVRDPNPLRCVDSSVLALGIRLEVLLSRYTVVPTCLRAKIVG